MAHTLLTSVTASLGTNGGTTSAIDTTGANFLAVLVNYDSAHAPTFSDSKGNTWTVANIVTAAAGLGTSILYYCNSPTVGTGHTFTVTAAACAASIVATAWVADYTLYPDKINDANGSSPLSTGSITPSENDELLLVSVISSGGPDGNTCSTDNGFTEIGSIDCVGSVNWGISLQYKVQGTAAAINPASTYAGSISNDGTLIVSFGSSSVGSGNTATFINEDTTTQGSWIGVYGSDGYYFPVWGVYNSPPPYILNYTVKSADGIFNASEYNWGSSRPSTELKSLQDPNNPTGDRWAITYYDSNTLYLNIDVGVGTPRRVAIYFLDDDSFARSNNIAVQDASTLNLLDAGSVSSFQNGKWQIWEITGSIRFKFDRTGGPNAVFAAVMFDTPVTETLEQYAYRWRNDDGSEASATWKAAEDTNTSVAKLTPTRLRIGVNATGDASPMGAKLQYRKVGDTEWRDVKTQE